jgi:hypothetical protein
LKVCNEKASNYCIGRFFMPSDLRENPAYLAAQSIIFIILRNTTIKK